MTTQYQDKVIMGNAEIDNINFTEALEKITTLAKEHRSHYVVTPNADHIVQLQTNTDFQKVYDNASVITADGMPLIWGAKYLGTPLKERVTGADLLPHLCAEAAKQGLTVYFLGAAEGVAQKAADNLVAKHPALKVAGLYSPPFGFEKDEAECQRIVEKINACEPDILFVGLGAPKQEFWMAKYQSQIKIGIMLGIGAAIAFAAGVEKRAPVFMQKTGLEWFYRLIHDPRRLTRRYLKDFAFFKIVWRQKRQHFSS